MVTVEPLDAINQLLLLAVQMAKQPPEAAYLRLNAVPMMILDVFEGLPIEQIVHWFPFIEENIDLIAVFFLSLFCARSHFQSLVSDAGDQAAQIMGGAMVRAFMSVIKRLSKSSDVIFSGRILMCLSKVRSWLHMTWFFLSFFLISRFCHYSTNPALMRRAKSTRTT
jgi:hypothetical protein